MFSLLVCFLLFGSSYAKLPEVTCSLSSSDLNTCLKNSINNLIPQWSSEGIPEVKLQPLDPLMVKGIELSPKEKRVSGKLLITDLVIKGLAKTQITSLSSVLKTSVDQVLAMQLTNPKLEITGKYKGNLMVDSMNVFGDGMFKLHLSDIKVKGKLLADSVKGQDGKQYFTVKTVDVVPVLGSLKVNATNLFKENTGLANFVLNMVNNYWRPYYDQVFPQVKPFLNNCIKDKINQFTTEISVDKIVKP